MVKFSAFFLALVLAPALLVAESLYFDVGIGVGSAKTFINGTDVMSSLGSGIHESGVAMGLKAGYGPLASLPLYFVGEFSSIRHRFYDSSNYLQFNSYLIGPGLIFYPTPLIQLAGSFGFSYVENQTDLPMSLYQSNGGTAGDVSVAFDFGIGNNGVLVGLGYAWANNVLKTSGAEQKDTIVDVFLRYTYREKLKPDSPQ